MLSDCGMLLDMAQKQARSFIRLSCNQALYNLSTLKALEKMAVAAADLPRERTNTPRRDRATAIVNAPAREEGNRNEWAQR